ncbi:MAG: PAS domain-containing protein, partial [Methylococcaceae bacterium]
LLAAFRQRSDGSCYGAYASLKMRELFGLGFEDIKDDIGPLQALLHLEDLPLLIKALKEAAQIMTSIRQAFRVNHPNKGEIWVEAHATPVLESDGSIIWYGYFADVTERHGLQNVLTEREREFRTLAENAPDTIIRYDRETRVLYMNPALERLLGQTNEQALGKRSDELFPQSEVMRRYQAMLEQVIATGEPAAFEIVDEMLGSNRTMYSLVRFAAELDNQGRIVGAIAIGRNYTVQKRLEQELVRREQAFRTLVENSPDVIVRYDLDCRRIYINPAFEREMGITESNKTQGEICKHLIFSEEYRLRLKRVMELGEADTILLEWYEPNGRRISYTMYAVAEYDEDGQVIGALAIGRNITELKATERYLEESRAQLRALTAKREKADEEERKRIGREIHDELGQLLSVMRLNVTTLDFRYGDSNPDLRDKVQKIVSILDRTIAKVRNLATRLRPVMLNFGIISALAWLVKDYAESTGIDCKLHVSVEDIPLDEDRAIVVFRIVQESLTNILRHSGAGRVVISLRNDAGVCEVDVQDNGKGFDPAAAGKRDSHGIIGMRERALMLNGTLDIVPAKTGGTVLKLRIPITATA